MPPAAPVFPPNIARRLAAASPSAKLPCPFCGASLRADRFDRHIDKNHSAMRMADATSWPGADRRSLRLLFVLTLAWTVASFVAFAMLPDTLWRASILAILGGLVAGGGLMALTALGRMPARLTLERDALGLRYGIGLLRRSVHFPAATEFGRAYWKRPRPTARHDALHAPGVEEDSGSYLRLYDGSTDLIVRCPQDCLLDRHWSFPGGRRGPKRDRWDISLDRTSFAALEYALADRGVLTPRAD